MNNQRLLIALVIGLLVSNLALLAFLFAGRGGGHHRGHRAEQPREVISDRLGFSESQRADYAALIQSHKQALDSNREAMRVAKQALYATLSDEADASPAVDGLLSRLGQLQQEAER